LNAVKKINGRLLGLMFFLGWLTGVVVEDGDLSSVDANRRLQMAKSWHIDQPEVAQDDKKYFGVRAPDGIARAWYGPGQAITMFPSEVLSSWLIRILGLHGALAEKSQHALVVYTVFPIIAGLGCVAVFLMLQAAGFTEKPSLFGSLGLLYGSTFLHYAQVNQENSLLLLCFAISLWAGLRIGQGGGSAYGIALGFSAGFAALIRMTTLAETAAVFLLTLILVLKQADGFRKAKAGIGSALGVFSFFLILERIYHHHRFGDWTSTYFKFFKEQWPQLDSPGDFLSGVWGFMFSPSESVWLFDPLAVLGAGLLIFGLLRKKITIWSPISLAALASLGVLAVYVVFYAPISFWNGASAWGSRYTTTPMQILSALTAAWIWQNWCILKKRMQLLAVGIVFFAVMTQLLSLLFWHNLEEIQLAARPEPWGVLVQRGINVTAKFSGNWQAWGLDLPGVSERLQTWNFAPFLSEKYLPPRVSLLFFAGWVLLLAALVGLNYFIWKWYLLSEDKSRG
jgi:hypothetical protein